MDILSTGLSRKQVFNDRRVNFRRNINRERVGESMKTLAERKLVMNIRDGMEFKGVGGLCKRVVHPLVNDSKNLGMTIAYVYPGEELPFHSHDNEEAYYIAQGSCTMKLGSYPDEEIHLHKDMVIYMPGGEPHYTKNTGNEPLVLVCALAPPPTVMDKE